MTKGKETKPHIGILGRRNSGKSSLINAMARQEIAIVSNTPGTTTDPVKKSIEIPGLGPSVLIDTAGIDDTGELGQKRIAKTHSALKTIDLAILVISENQFGDDEIKIIEELNDFGIPFFILHNKQDFQPLNKELAEYLIATYHTDVVEFSARYPADPDRLALIMKKLMPVTAYTFNTMLGGLIKQGDPVLLVTPIDTEAPEGRMILPQVQAIRDILDNHAVAIVLKESELEVFLGMMQPKPVLVITDSQMFGRVSKIVPESIPLTGFSIMLARYKGDFDNYLKGTPHLSKLKDGDKILILESCTHHVTCDDIGRYKIPRWVSEFSGKKLDFTIVSGLSDLPHDIKDYAMVIQCGGCMITNRQIINRLKAAVDAGIPVTNYGMVIAWTHGIYNRAIAPFLNSEVKM
ncbi:MAG: [FeFe] hydrogenase H-cluster maturation GTPase HydF [Sphingobacteriia bacterium]|nr:[FeFe] hydrogenase H-cluster maturation GTPase HydF [Sphingobacteriia bacterium]